jgi:hypothetical protein
MKRLLVLFAVLVPLSLFVTGCDGAGGSGKSGQPSAEDKQKRMEETQQKMKAMKMATGQAPGGAPTK